MKFYLLGTEKSDYCFFVGGFVGACGEGYIG